MPVRGIVETARSVAYYLRKQEVEANNLANTGTDAFKVDIVTAHQMKGSQIPVPVQHTDFQQGSFRDTGRTLDVALDGPGFLVVETANGERLFRGGSLQIDPVGRLTDAHGDPVQGINGQIVLDDGAVVVLGDGTFLIDGDPVGQLRMETVEDLQTLQKEGLGRYVAQTPLQRANEDVTRVRQGVVEQPNFDALTSMVDLITIQRMYSANMDALKAMDSVLGTVTGQVGRVR